MSPLQLWCFAVFSFAFGFAWSRVDDDGVLPGMLVLLTLAGLAVKGLLN